jgi:hypothetical protein
MRRTVPILFAAAAAAALWATPVFAQHDQDGEHAQPGEKHAAPATYAEAVAEIDERLENIDGLIKGKKLDDVHKEAQVIVDVAKTLAALALKPDSGVPKEAVKDINRTAKELAGKFDAIDKAGDAGDEAATKTVLAEMIALQATLKKYAPADGDHEHAADTYYCVMHCEGSKTYDKPGKCPVCGMSLKKLTTDKYSVHMGPHDAIQAGKPVSLTFEIDDPMGLPVKNLQTVHEKVLHLLVVSKDLSWFSHEHPQLGADGKFTIVLAFPQPGDYILYHDFTPEEVGQQVVQVSMSVAGTPAAPVALRVDAGQPKSLGGYTVSIDTGSALVTGGESHLIYTITKDGTPVTDLQPYLGAMGHLVIISQDLQSFVHSHPHEKEGQGGAGHDATGPKVDFEASFEKPGLYKGWAQFQHLGKVVTVPFTFEVGQGALAPGGHDHPGDAGHDGPK